MTLLQSRIYLDTITIGLLCLSAGIIAGYVWKALEVMS